MATKSKNSQFTGDHVRELRKKHQLSRKEMADLLGVSPVTVEKWEQAGFQSIRPKYHKELARLAGLATGAGVVGLAAAPVALAALPVLGALGVSGVMAKKVWSDASIDEVEEVLHALRRLSPKERETWFKLCRKMAGDDEVADEA